MNRHVKKGTKWAVVAIIATIWGATGCSEFIETPINDDRVELLSPGAHAEAATYTIQFLWEPLDYALNYRLQVASPNFTNTGLFYADTLVEKPTFATTLAPGKYQWRVKAVNGISETAYTTRSFTIHEADLTKQTVLLEGPATYTVVADSPITLRWQELFSALSYRLQIDTLGFAGASKHFVVDQPVEGLQFTFNPPAEDDYQWRVRAERDTIHSNWSIVRNFTFDKTPPIAPTLVAPTNGAQVNRPILLKWGKVADAASYRVYVYKGDSTIYDATFPVTQTDTTYRLDAGTRRDRILWRVQAVDRAGNAGVYSAWGSFIIRN